MANEYTCRDLQIIGSSEESDKINNNDYSTIGTQNNLDEFGNQLYFDNTGLMNCFKDLIDFCEEMKSSKTNDLSCVFHKNEVYDFNSEYYLYPIVINSDSTEFMAVNKNGLESYNYDYACLKTKDFYNNLTNPIKTGKQQSYYFRDKLDNEYILQTSLWTYSSIYDYRNCFCNNIWLDDRLVGSPNDKFETIFEDQRGILSEGNLVISCNCYINNYTPRIVLKRKQNNLKDYFNLGQMYTFGKCLSKCEMKVIEVSENSVSFISNLNKKWVNLQPFYCQASPMVCYNDVYTLGGNIYKRISQNGDIQLDCDFDKFGSIECIKNCQLYLQSRALEENDLTKYEKYLKHNCYDTYGTYYLTNNEYNYVQYNDLSCKENHNDIQTTTFIYTLTDQEPKSLTECFCEGVIYSISENLPAIAVKVYNNCAVFLPTEGEIIGSTDNLFYRSYTNTNDKAVDYAKKFAYKYIKCKIDGYHWESDLWFSCQYMCNVDKSYWCQEYCGYPWFFKDKMSTCINKKIVDVEGLYPDNCEYSIKNTAVISYCYHQCINCVYLCCQSRAIPRIVLKRDNNIIKFESKTDYLLSNNLSSYCYLIDCGGCTNNCYYHMSNYCLCGGAYCPSGVNSFFASSYSNKCCNSGYVYTEPLVTNDITCSYTSCLKKFLTDKYKSCNFPYLYLADNGDISNTSTSYLCYFDFANNCFGTMNAGNTICNCAIKIFKGEYYEL